MDYPVPFPDSYWVIPGELLAGEYPGVADEQLTRRRLQALLRLGIQVVIDMTEEGASRPYLPLLLEEAEGYEVDVRYQRIPIPDYSVPDAETTRQALDLIDAARQAGQPVYLHCQGGIGRTGTVVGCYLVRQGLSGEQALQALADRRAGTPSGMWRSPETEEQVAWVLNWPQGG